MTEQQTLDAERAGMPAVSQPPLQVTPPSQWRNRGELVELPCGAVVRLRSISLGACLLRGEVPNALASYAKDMMTGGKALEDAKRGDALKSIEFMAWLCSYALLEPRLYQGNDAPPDDCITLSDLTDVDQAFIARYAQGETLDLSNFR